MAKDLRISYLLDFYGDMLTDKQREVVELYYNEDLSLAEIAAISKITRQGVRDSIKRAESQLLEYEERLGLAQRFRQVQAAAGEIRRLAKEIDFCNNKYSFANEISENARQIIRLADSLDD